MKTLTLALLTLCSHAAITVSATGGTYTVQAEDFDSKTGGSVVADSGIGGTIVDGASELVYDLTGLDAGYTYDYALTVYLHGQRDVDVSADMEANSFSLIGEHNGFNAGENDAITNAVPGANFWTSTVNNILDIGSTTTGLASTDDTLTINLTDVAHFDSFELIVTATPIPEPTSAALLGLGALAFVTRRKR